MARKKRNNAARKARNRERSAALFDGTSGAAPRIRRTFSGKARKGDAAELSFVFSGVPVPIEKENPTEGLLEKTAAQAALWQRLEKGTLH